MDNLFTCASTHTAAPIAHGHGPRCECLCLAAATHAGAEAIPFSYCYHVLQKRYRMQCRHGESPKPEAPGPAEPEWSMYREMDAVKAVLMING